ncbi:hypothetical protein [Actinoplanes solisilvae]|uniref:hypothetical protein n=1 Tax=Actinoplanes solisilvae TaxID=2486853 RepID=UPI00196AAB63|nr:hypothetical protein [Actinoplanes solisilvae]
MAGTGVRVLAATRLAVPAGHWPIATFSVNIIGAFILGNLVEMLSEEQSNQQRADWGPTTLLAGPPVDGRCLKAGLQRRA